MYINITDSETGDNKGSSGQLVHYLDKENRMSGNREPEQWFNGDRADVPSHLVKSSLDNNIAKLSKEDAKFFLINISPSQKEIAWLKEQFGEEGAKEQLKAYAIRMMDEYARNFHRPGIESHKDLLWFAKLENHRYYSHRDKEVKEGKQKAGTPKPGEQMHIQVIVSRKDTTNKIKLSPLNKSRGKNAAHSAKLGQFDRSAFKQSGEIVFDRQFGFDRNLEDTFQYANTQKNGSLEQRLNLRLVKEKLDQAKALFSEKAQAASKHLGAMHDKAPYQHDTTSAQQTGLLETLLNQQDYSSGPFIPRKKRKKRKKGQQQDQSHTM